MNELQQLLGSTYPWAAQRAQDAINIKQALDAQQITKDQATQMLQDLIATDTLDAEANDFATKTKIVNAITDLINVISSASSIPGL